MTGNELYAEYCNEYPLIQGYREVSYESWLQQQVVEYRTQVVNKNGLLPFVMPRSLTAENGAKGLLIGEFKESVEATDSEWGDYTIDVPVEWTTIKDIYAKIVEHYGA